MRQTAILSALAGLLAGLPYGHVCAQVLSNAEIERRIIEARQIGYNDGFAKGFAAGRYSRVDVRVGGTNGGATAGGSTNLPSNEVFQLEVKKAGGTSAVIGQAPVFLRFDADGPIGLTLKNEQGQPETRVWRYTWDDLGPLLQGRNVGALDPSTPQEQRRLIDEAIKAAPPAPIR